MSMKVTVTPTSVAPERPFPKLMISLAGNTVLAIGRHGTKITGFLLCGPNKPHYNSWDALAFSDFLGSVTITEETYGPRDI